QFVAWTIRCGQAPAALAVSLEFVGIALGVLALDQRRAPAVLKVVAALLAHEAVADAAKIDPRVRVLVDEQRAAVEAVDSIQVLPLIGGRPCVIAVTGQGMRRRSQRKHVENDRLVVTLPAVVQESAFRLPALTQCFAAILCPAPVDSAIKYVDPLS